MFESARNWFDGLEPRERWMVSLCGVVVAATLLYVVVVKPYLAHRQQLTTEVAQKHELLAWMQDAKAEIRALESQGRETSAGSGESLFSVVDSTAKEAGLGSALRQITPDGDSAVRVRLDTARFDYMLQWLGQLEQSHGVSVTRVTFDRASEPGRVNVSLTLEQEVA